MGPDVKKLKPGDRVTSERLLLRMKRVFIVRITNIICVRNRVGIGTKANGSMANYVLTREESAHILPDNVSYKMAAMSNR
ncbi:L-iditol 2-dehydrogenase [Lactiplantibacillus plantarum subsp. plantarum]|uniref:L-iditol 2-dehydrogenase n=1 Tax=Lactiplantibacillus plantarum subsp. plantarum TaxID=337330 RepID=A0A2S3U7M0_LACPN|nr:L-iditol 2-dehydrogenase [Lactiplantibacillus plantarum subsp. plantarum]